MSFSYFLSKIGRTSVGSSDVLPAWAFVPSLLLLSQNSLTESEDQLPLLLLVASSSEVMVPPPIMAGSLFRSGRHDAAPCVGHSECSASFRRS
jgi:hypothetical protein